MKLFLIWPGSYNRIKGLISAIEKENHQIVYWTISEDGQGKIPGAVFHNYLDAYGGIPAQDFSLDEFPPPSRTMLKQYVKLESMILTMMNKRFNKLCVDERKHIYYNMIRYWQGVINKYKPNAVIFSSSIPHSVFDYIIYQLAQDLGIKTIMFEHAWTSDRLIMHNGKWEQGSKVLQKEIEKNLGQNFSLKDLSPQLREYYKLQTDSRRDLAPIWTRYIEENFAGRKNILRSKLKIIRESIKKGVFLKRGIDYVIKQFKPNLRKEYLSLQSEVDLSEKFVYVALQYQPECSICPQGDTYWDQILMVETISFALPKGWLLYVKEHPTQWLLGRGVKYSSNRYPGYYKRLSKIKNVRLIPIDTNTFTLINKSQAVATTTGSVGWEALFRGKAALVFGQAWYKDCPEILRVGSVDDCCQAFNKIINGYLPDKQQVINYLKSLDTIATEGYFNSTFFRTADSQEGIANLAEAILSQLN